MQSTSYGYDYRAIEYLDVANDGRAVGFVCDVSTASYHYVCRGGQYIENLGYVGSIDLDPATGALQAGSFCRELTTPAGTVWPNSNAWYRIAPAMAHHWTSDRLVAALVAAYPGGASNENLKNVYLFAPTADDPGQTDLGLSTARYNVLNVGR
jgi:hypothetical protein